MARKVKPPVAAETPSAPLPEGPILAHVRGHDSVITTLLSAIGAGRLPSTLLFSGPSGVGKRLAALGVAQSLVCETDVTRGAGSRPSPMACGYCGACLRIARRQSESLFVVEPEGTGIKIEQSQDVLRFISLTQLGRSRIVLIDDAHTLNPQAGNALLKSLEEPPPGTHFVLVTSNAGAILGTIRSRAQTIRFHALDDEIVRSLTGAEDWIVRSAQGSVEAARKMIESSDEWAGLRRLSLAVLEELSGGREDGSVDALKERVKDRGAALFVSQIWGRALRDVLLTRLNGREDAERLLLPDAQLLSAQLASRMSVAWTERLAELNRALEQDIVRNVDRNLAFETFCRSVIRACTGRESAPVLS